MRYPVLTCLDSCRALQVPDAVIVAGIGTMSRMTSAWQLPFRPRNGLVKIPGKDNDYCEVVVLGPLTGPLPRRQYNVAAQGDAAEGVLCYDPSKWMHVPLEQLPQQ
jgi:hypothetical protein